MFMESCIERREFDEFKQRLEEQKARWDRRIDTLEQSVGKIHSLTTSVEKLAQSIEHMAQEQAEMNERLKTIENRDGEMWRKIASYGITAILGAVIAFFFSRFGV